MKGTAAVARGAWGKGVKGLSAAAWGEGGMGVTGSAEGVKATVATARGVRG